MWKSKELYGQTCTQPPPNPRMGRCTCSMPKPHAKYAFAGLLENASDQSPGHVQNVHVMSYSSSILYIFAECKFLTFRYLGFAIVF